MDNRFRVSRPKPSRRVTSYAYQLSLAVPAMNDTLRYQTVVCDHVWIMYG